MKREFPALYAAVSIWIATPLLGFWTVFYAQRAVTQAANEVYPTDMAAFGVTAALSAICFSKAPVCDNPPTPQYAGEKFLHSSLLLVQTLLVLYVRDAADPLFTDPANGDFSLGSGSPAYNLGFQPIDVSTVGPQAQ